MSWFWENPGGTWTASFGLVRAVVVFLDAWKWDAIVEDCSGYRHWLGTFKTFREACNASVGAAAELVYDSLEQIGEYEII